MGLIRSAFARASLGGTSGIATPEKWVEDWVWGGDATASGVHVNEETALHYGPFFAGVRVISEDVGSLPLPVYERIEGGKRRAVDHPLYRVLRDEANPLMSSLDLRRTLQGHALTWGNGYARIIRDGAGNVTELWPLRPDRTKPDIKRTKAGQFDLFYRYTDDTNGIRTVLLPDEVLHIRGLGYDGVRGYSVVALARQAIGIGLATEKYGARFFGNGSKPGGVLQHPDAVSDGARKRMKTDWENLHRGLDRSHQIAILEEGVTWQSIGIPPEDAQFLETRRFQVTEMARWLRLPPHKIGDLERATFTNIEHQGLDYVTSALRIWLTTWEQTANLRLLTAGERSRYFTEHIIDALLRGDIKTRYDAYAVGRNWGWLSADDVREMENRNPLPDGRGSVYLIPLNMVPAPAPEDTEGEEGSAALRVPSRRLDMIGRGTEARRRIAKAFAPLVADADLRVAKLERAEVKSLARRHLQPRAGRSTSAFLAAVTDLYQGLVAERTTQAWLPVLSALSAEIVADAAADVGYEDEVDLTTWIAAYVASHVGYRVATAIGGWSNLVADTDLDDLVDAVLVRLDKAVEDRPGKTAQWETTQLSEATAREVWRAAGIRNLTWVSSGDTCPYCVHLDGKTVGIESSFLSAGDTIDGAEEGEQLEVTRKIHHPPVHPGCDCKVVPA